MKKRKLKIALKTKRMKSASAQVIDMSEFEGTYSIEEMKEVLKVMKKKLTNGRN